MAKKYRISTSDLLSKEGEPIFPDLLVIMTALFFSPFRDVLLLQQVQVLKRFWH